MSEILIFLGLMLVGATSLSFGCVRFTHSFALHGIYARIYGAIILAFCLVLTSYPIQIPFVPRSDLYFLPFYSSYSLKVFYLIAAFGELFISISLVSIIAAMWALPIRLIQGEVILDKSQIKSKNIILVMSVLIFLLWILISALQIATSTFSP